MTGSALRTSALILLTLIATAEAALAQARPPAKAPEKQADEATPAMAVPKNYKYEPRGRRDPFVNPVPKRVVEKAEPEVPVVRPPGLKGVMVSEAKVVGVVWSRERSMNLAVIVAPGNRTYFAAPGDALFDGTIREVQRDAVVFSLARPGAEPIVRKVRTTGE